ncbi:putative T7SS-secreted protein [Nocardia sp. NPDC058658]|uniref:putative T7SS-secreted protein n=1 Tax=Nocardia sp. NPDC058658 TaxID=3346580 RepID=UPI00364F62B2
MGIGDFIDKVGGAIEDGVENVVEGAGQIIDDGLDVVGDAAEHVGLEKIGNALDDLGDNIASATGGDVEEEELGQTEDPKELILGEPSEIASAAETLNTMADAIESTGQALQKIDAAEWTGKGADAFNAVYDKQPKLWFDGADAMAAAAEALKAWQNEVKTAQGKAQTAIDRWKDADSEERRQKTWWNGLTGEQQQANPLVDTWTAMRNEAREILRGARVQRDNGASIAVGAITTATERAPKEPPFSERWIANISDLKGVLDHAALNFTAGFLTAVTGMVQFVRQVNPTDIYNITHPAEYAKGLSDLGTGLVVAVADPGAAVDAILKEARANPFEFAGSLAPDLILTAATGGGGSVKTAASALKRVADAGRRVSGRDTGSPDPNPARQTEPSGQQDPRRSAGLPNSTDNQPPGNTRPVEAAPQREAPAPRTEDTGTGTGGNTTPERTEPRQAEPDTRTEPDNDPNPAAADPAPTREPEPTRQESAPERSPDPDPPPTRTEPRPEAAGTTDPHTPQRTDPTPTHQNDTPTQHPDPAPTNHTETPTQRTDPAPAHHTDTPTQRADPASTHQQDAPTQRTDPVPNHQTDVPTQRSDSSPNQQANDVPPQRGDSTPGLSYPSDAPHPRADGGPDSPTTRPDSDNNGNSEPEIRPTSDTSPSSTSPDTRPNPATGDTPSTSNPATPSPIWQPGHTAHPDSGTAPRSNPDGATPRTQPGTSPAGPHSPQSPARPEPTSPRQQRDSTPESRATPDTPRASAAPDSPGRPLDTARSPEHSPRTITPRTDSPTRDTPHHATPRTPHTDTPTDRTPGRREPDTPTDRTPDRRDPDVPTDRTPDHRDHDSPTDRDPDSPTDRTPERDPDTDRSKDREPDNTPDRDPDNHPDRDTDNPTDRADADRDAHDHARTSGAEHDRTPDQKTCSKDPVDISTGEFLLPETDLELPGVLPLVLRRSHHSNFRFGRWFGPSWSGTLDARIIVADGGVTFVGEEGIMLAFPHAGADEPVHPLTGGRAWSLTRTDTGGYRVWDRCRELIWHFAPEPGLDGLDAQLGNYAVSAITDRHHNRVRFHYDTEGVPVEVSHSGGYRVRVDTAGGRVTGLTLVAEGHHETVREFGYTSGELTAVTTAVGATTHYTYDAHHRMTSWTDSNGNQMVNTFDEYGRVIHQRGTAGILNCDYEYIEFPGGTGRLTAVTDTLGAVTSHGFDRELQLRDLVTPDGAHFHTDYNADRKPLTVVGPDPATTTTYRYNGAGDPVEIVRPDGVSLEYDYAWRDRPSTITTADGAVHRRDWSDNGDLLAATDPSGSRTEFTYHPSGAPADVVVDGVRTTVRVDTAGLPIALVDVFGATTRIERDAAGRVVRTVDPAGAVTHYEWSPAGNLLSRTHPDDRRESWTYDGEGNIVAHTDPAGGVTAYAYGAFDLLAARTDADGSLTRYEWDTERRLIAVHNPLRQSWTYEYDTAGRLVAETDYTATTTTYTWDAAGRLATVTPATGTTRRHRYDILGRRTEIVTDDGDWIRHTYDATGRILTASTGNGETPCHTIEYTYSPAGLLESEQVDARPPLCFTYDQHGRRVARTSPTGAETTWHHDLAGRVDRIGIGEHDITLEYNLAGHLTGWRLGEVAVSREVTELGQLVGQEVTAFPARLVSLDLGGPTRPAPQSIRRDEFRYRADGYLTAQRTTRPDTAALCRDYTLDAGGRVTAVAHNDHPAEHYSYDPLGNITTGPREYRGNLLIHDGHSHYDYDRAGRLIRKISGERTWHYRYNSFDQLTDVYTPDRQWWRYTYDALGRRTTKQHLAVDGTVLAHTDYTWDDTRLIESSSGTTTTRWEYRPGTPTPLTQTIDHPTSPECCAVITDLAGTPTELVDPTTGRPTATATISLWGHTTWHGTTSTPLRFPGQFHDPESGLHYNFHRVYDPHTARYLTRDPLGLTPSPNPHTYPHNPLTWRDPLGLLPKECKDDDDEPDDEPSDTHDVTVPNPTPTQPAVKTGQLPVTPETLPDPNTSPGTGRAGSSEEPDTEQDAGTSPQADQDPPARTLEEVLASFHRVDQTHPAIAHLVELQRTVRRVTGVGWKTMGGAVEYMLGGRTGSFAGFSGQADVTRNAPRGSQLPEVAPPTRSNSVVPDPTPPRGFRPNDAENNMIEHLINKIRAEFPDSDNNPDQVTGRVTVFSEQRPCESCGPMLSEFINKYRHLEVEVYFVTDYPPVAKGRPTL